MAEQGEGSPGPQQHEEVNKETEWKTRMEKQLQEVLEAQNRIMATLMAQVVPPPIVQVDTQPVASPEVSRAEGGTENIEIPVVSAGVQGQVPLQETLPANPVAPVDTEKALYWRTRKEFMKYDIMRFDGSMVD
ncbi:hypothetical protein Sjap_005663 [Stephania japonica]|uniref:Uncharacterized protein n=1 Tax=Stephania japonica TaxID=461633 RepID=A0AAP0K5L8_9MAGN